MNAEQLYEFIIQDISNEIAIEKIHPLHKAILEECCENALSNPQKVKGKKILKYAAKVAFLKTLPTLQGTLKAGLEHAEKINLNYRNQTFAITENSPVLNDF